LSSVLNKVTRDSNPNNLLRISKNLFEKLNQWDWLSLVLPTLLLLPQLLIQARFLNTIRHLQFYPLAIAATVFFTYTEFQKGNQQHGLKPWRRIVGYTFLPFAWSLVCLASLTDNHWLAHVAIVTCVATWGLVALPGTSVWRWCGIFSITAVTIPIPFSFDHQLIRLLQAVSSRLASMISDIILIPHLPTGNIIELPSRQLFVEEACSGVDSQYALMSIALVMLILQTPPAWIIALTITTVPLIALFGNVLRILSIIVADHFFKYDLAHGWSHTILGLIVFCIAAFVHFASVRLFMFIDYRIRNQVVDSAITSVSNSKDLALAKVRTKLPLTPIFYFAAIGLAPFSALGWASTYNQIVLQKEVSLNSAVIDQLPSKESLPSEVGGLRLMSFETVGRDVINSQGQHSNIWRYSNGSESAIFSVDMLFRGWHALWECYVNTGWERSDVRPLKNEDDSIDCYVVILKDSLQNHGLLLFSLTDTRGTPFLQHVSLKIERESSALERIRLGFSRLVKQASSTAEQTKTVQYQLFVTSKAEFNETEIERAYATFRSLRQNILPEIIRAFKDEVSINQELKN
jgi:exosortase